MARARGDARRPNRRGEGARLQDEVVAAASAILEKTGRDDALTLRAVAREAGITAPAIYAHFAGREDILHTVVRRTFGELTTALQQAVDRETEPVPRLLAVSRAYLDFAAERPHHYRVLFERHRNTFEAPATPAAVESMLGADAFGVLLGAMGACIEAGYSSAPAPLAPTTRIWVGLHGQATLRASLPWFPWPDSNDLLEEIVARLGDLRTVAR